MHTRTHARAHSKRGRKTRERERQHALSSRWSAQRAPPVPFLYTTAPGLHQPHQGLGRHSAQDVADSHCASSCAVIAVAAASAAAHLRSADIISLSGSLAHCSEVIERGEPPALVQARTSSSPMSVRRSSLASRRSSRPTHTERRVGSPDPSAPVVPGRWPQVVEE